TPVRARFRCLDRPASLYAGGRLLSPDRSPHPCTASDSTPQTRLFSMLPDRLDVQPRGLSLPSLLLQTVSVRATSKRASCQRELPYSQQVELVERRAKNRWNWFAALSE